MAMTDQVKLPVVEQQVTPGADFDRRRLLDALEDDEVRQALKHDGAPALPKPGGRTPHD
jgi:hypothetical protein